MLHRLVYLLFLIPNLLNAETNTNPYDCDSVLLDSNCQMYLIICNYKGTEIKALEYVKINNERSGIFKSYYENTQLRAEGFLKANYQINNYTTYYEDGSVSVKGKYCNHLGDTIREYFYIFISGTGDSYLCFPSNDVFNPNFSYVFEDTYSVRIGEWICYYPNGKPIVIFHYDEKGRLISEKYFDPQGEETAKENIIKY